MIVFLIYLFVILALIYFNGFFGLFKDSNIKFKQLTFLFFIKCLAIPVFFYVYQNVYGGIEKFDSGKFYNDASVISDIAKKDFLSYLKILFGFQNDAVGSYDFILVKNTLNWDNGEIKDFLYNDNRVLIRIHSLFHFISFNSFLVHALFSCFISFIGLFYIYKTFKNYFTGKEIWLLLVMCLLPALWFYTGAPLKEGLSVFILGCSLYLLKQLTVQSFNMMRVIKFLVFLWLSLLLKPYLLFFALLCFGIFFSIEKLSTSKFKGLLFILILGSFLIFLNLFSVLIKHKSLTNAALEHQRLFAGVAKGGLFLVNEQRFVRLAFDSSLVKAVPNTLNVFTIQKRAPYMYWENTVAHDTLFCESNQDTITRYQLAYKIPENRSNLKPIIYTDGPLALLVNSYYYTLCFPLFFNAKSALHYLASLENLVILFCFCLVFIGMIRRKKASLLPLVFITFALGICLLIGVATPNSGAIFRYRSPAMIFVLLSALYYIDLDKMRIFKRNP